MVIVAAQLVRRALGERAGGSAPTTLTRGGRAPRAEQRLDGRACRESPRLTEQMGLDNPLHIAFLVVILLLVFGAKRLPEIGRSLGSRHAGVQGLGHRRVARRRDAAAAAGAQPPQQPPPPAPAAAQPRAGRGRRRAAGARRGGAGSSRQQHALAGTSPRGPRSACAAAAGARRAAPAQPRWRIGPVCTASNAEPGTRLSWSRSSSFQRGSGAPVMYQERAVVGDDQPVALQRPQHHERLRRGSRRGCKLAFRRRRSPIGGSAGSDARGGEVRGRVDVAALGARDGHAQGVVDRARRAPRGSGRAAGRSAARPRRPRSSLRGAARCCAG